MLHWLLKAGSEFVMYSVTCISAGSKMQPSPACFPCLLRRWWWRHWTAAQGSANSPHCCSRTCTPRCACGSYSWLPLCVGVSSLYTLQNLSLAGLHNSMAICDYCELLRLIEVMFSVHISPHHARPTQCAQGHRKWGWHPRLTVEVRQWQVGEGLASLICAALPSSPFSRSRERHNLPRLHIVNLMCASCHPCPGAER